jgi:uncharacterized protein (TIGR03118 family)
MTRVTALPAGIRRGLIPAAAIVTSATLAVAAFGSVPGSATTARGGYRQINLVSDLAMKGVLKDPDLVNAWGLAASPGTNAKPGSPLWVADNGTDKATLYAGTGPASVAKVGLVVNVRGAAPTGQVFNPFPHAFGVSDGQGHHAPALFVFDTENGTIDGWSPTIGAVGKNPSTTTFVLHRKAGAVYKGLATARFNGEPVLYATNFHSGKVEAYDRSLHPMSLPGRFVDPNLPAGYAPFGIAEINGNLIVTYAKQDADRHDDVKGLGHGFIDMFGNGGHFLGRLGTRGPLDSPWGIALAPQGFGRWAGALLIGNFGNGHINVYNPTVLRHGHLGQMLRPSGRPMVIPGLWGLMAGNGNAAKTSEVLFSAGPADESHGLLGKFVPQIP